MKYKLIIRKIQLYKLGYGDKPKELEVLEKMKGLKWVMGSEQEGVYYDNGSKILIHINDKIYINYDKVWGIFISKYKMVNKDIQSLTTWYIKNIYDFKFKSTDGFYPEFLKEMKYLNDFWTTKYK